MVELYLGLKLLIPVILIGVIILCFVIIIVTNFVNSKFKKNCFDCKHYKLFDVASVGDGCKYKCNLKGHIDRHNMNNKCKYIKCENFEIK